MCAALEFERDQMHVRMFTLKRELADCWSPLTWAAHSRVAWHPDFGVVA